MLTFALLTTIVMMMRSRTRSVILFPSVVLVFLGIFVPVAIALGDYKTGQGNSSKLTLLISYLTLKLV